MAWEYAAIMMMDIKHNVSGLAGSFWVLYQGKVKAGRVFGDTGELPHLRTNLVDKNLDEIYNRIMEIKSGTREQTHETEIDDLDKELKKEFAQLINQDPCIITGCHFVATNSLKLVNIAGGRGWETTGQVPGYPGPTGITMMRKRIE